MDRNKYIAVFAGLVIVILFFVVLGGGLPFGGDSQEGGEVLSDFSPDGENGLVVQDVIEGTGEEALPGKVLTVHYAGALEDGTIFESSVGGEPFTFLLGAGQVIAGWEEGLVGMKVGGQRILVIPPELGYGQTENGPIPANSTLIFQVELLEVADQ